MIKGLESILLGTDNAAKLAGFYRDTLGLKQTEAFETGEENEQGFMFDLGNGITLAVMSHSEVAGENKNPQRIMFNLETDDIKADIDRLKKSGVTVIQDQYHVESYGWVATFADSDQNYFQLVQIRPTRRAN